jgi:hypothetical protein
MHTGYQLVSLSERFFTLAILPVFVILISCGPESRTEGRQRRLDSFRAVLPEDIRQAFDSIDAEDGCVSVALMLSDARERDPQLNAAIDSIMQAELIETFSDRDIVNFFWFYFAHAIETGTVPEP